MYECDNCQRRFTTKGSLHRHGKNHQRAREFTCSLCSVSFVRQDLLNRHARIHEDGIATLTGRTRSRKACEACRRSRIKCNGRKPCEKCELRDLECVFEHIEQSFHTSRDVRGAGLSPIINATSVTSSSLPVSHNTQSLAVENVEGYGIDSELPELPLSPPAFSPLATTWPWLHEDLFLRSAVSLDFFDLTSAGSHTEAGVVANTGGLMGHQRGTALSNANYTGTPDVPDGPQEAVIHSVIMCATQWTKESKDTQLGSSFVSELKALSSDIATAFNLAQGDNLMPYFINLYEEHFWPLWPLVSRYQLHFHTLHPFLYLAMASIGAMYGGKNASTVGTILHNLLREEMIKPLFDYDISDGDLISLGQARSLTQAAALYFGQRKAFSFAQHIGANLIAQARRMNLFAAHPSSVQDFGKSTAWLDSWIRKENRKRLAFAILRLEMYTSILHSTRPLVSPEELDQELPCSRYVWQNLFDSPSSFAAAVKQEMSTQAIQLLFSDLVRIALDPDESLPHLEVLTQELVFNSVQGMVWAACTSRDSLERMTGCDIYNMMNDKRESGITDGIVIGEETTGHARKYRTSLDCRLALTSRTMQTLISTITTLVSVLQKCHESLMSTSISLYSPITTIDRGSLLSCLLTYHMSHLQLHAPLTSLHRACNFYNPVRSSPTPGTGTGLENKDGLAEIKSWCSTKSADIARQHASQIYHVLRSEADRPVLSRASVNFLTTIGLYHSAVVLWILERAGKVIDPDRWASAMVTTSILTERGGDTGHDDGGVEAAMCNGVESPPNPSTRAFVTLFYDINPAWVVRSSFCAAVEQLIDSPSPFEG